MPRTLPTPTDAASPLADSLAALGAIVRNQRARGRMRIDDAAALSHVSADVLSRLENGKPITLDKLMLLLNGLGLRLLVLPARDAERLQTEWAMSSRGGETPSEPRPSAPSPKRTSRST
jgi:transcriptional regulator with XRE-family HTH domain